MAGENRIDTENKIIGPTYDSVAVEIAVAVASATHAAKLAPGRYRMSSDTDLHWLQGVFGSTTALVTGHFLKAGAIEYFVVTLAASDDGIAAIRESADGTLWIGEQKGGIG
ncbi:MAG: hypothetical protein V3W44_09560 [Dehalococcoidales bacterium]